MRKFGKFLGAALCGLIIGASSLGTVNASAAELPKLDFKPKALNVEYGDNSDIASKFNVMIPGNSKLKMSGFRRALIKYALWHIFSE